MKIWVDDVRPAPISIAGVVSWDDAEDIIQDFINTGSLMEFGKEL